MLYTIVLIGALFGGKANTGMEFISHDACKAVASHIVTSAGVAKCEVINK